MTLTDTGIVEQAEALAVDFFRCMYGEHAVVPKEKLSSLPAYPCWTLACHAFEALLGIDPRDNDHQLPPPPRNGADAWKVAVVDNARRIERECQ